MDIKDAILGTIQKSGEIKGRTLLQKKLYFLSVLSGENFGFRAHYYGPYSSEVSDQLGALVQADLIQEQPHFLGVSSGPFGEARRYDYSLTDSGNEVFSHRQESMDEFTDEIVLINSDSVGDDANLISVAGKVHFILNDQKKATVTVQEIRELAQSEFGWEISKPDVVRVVDYLQLLNLAK